MVLEKDKSGAYIPEGIILDARGVPAPVPPAPKLWLYGGCSGYYPGSGR